MERRVDHIQNVTERNGRWGSCRYWVLVVPQLKVDRPVWNSVVRYSHSSDRRVRGGIAQFLLGNYGKLARSDVSHGRKGGRCKVEGKSRVGNLAIQKWMYLETGGRALARVCPGQELAVSPLRGTEGTSSRVVRRIERLCVWAGRLTCMP